MEPAGRIGLKTKLSTPLFTESIDFYQRVFGMTTLEAWDSPGDRGAILEFADGRGEAFLEIYYSEDRHDFSGLSLQFRVPDVDRFRATLDADIEAEGPIPRPWGARYLYLRDPNDVLVIVYSGGN